MSTMTATPSSTATPSKAGFKAWLRKLGAELRRAFELSGTPHADGPMPPL